MIRPGPERLAPGLAPGGVVLHVYNAAGRLLLDRSLRPGDDVEAVGGVDGERTAAQLDDDSSPVVVVVFDGDTGERHPEWVGLDPGTRL